MAQPLQAFLAAFVVLIRAFGSNAYTCRSDIDLGHVASADRKGLTLDDATLHTCSSQIPVLWPNTGEAVRSVRLFTAWSRSWPEATRELVWQSLGNFARDHNVRFLVGTQITCVEEDDEHDWKWTKQLLQLLGPDYVMGLAVGNELELLFTKDDPSVTPECIRRMWEGGYFWKQFVRRVRDFDALGGFESVPVTNAFGGLAIGGSPFFEAPGQALVNSFLQNASRTFRSRYAFTLNFYPYFDANMALDIGTTDKCSSAIRRASCWEANCSVPEVLSIARAKIEELTNRSESLFWVGETGWSAPGSSTLSTRMAACDSWSAMETMRQYYQGFLRWDMKHMGKVRPPDHVFYFTMRDSENFGFKEHFGLMGNCSDSLCKIRSQGYAAPAPAVAGSWIASRPSPLLELCSLPPEYSAAQLKELQQRNCRKVAEAGYGWRNIKDAGLLHPLLFRLLNVHSFKERGDHARKLCYESKLEIEDPAGDVQHAALLAVNAWSHLMNGGTCCSLAEPPYCVRGPNEGVGYGIANAPLVVAALLLLLPGALLKHSLRALGEPKEGYVKIKATDGSAQLLEQPPSKMVPPELHVEGRHPACQGELEALWLDGPGGSPLRVLPGAKAWAKSASSLFVALQEAFGFQGDSVRNMFEHLLSLWRCQCAVVASRRDWVDESSLLLDGLSQLHEELLSGFHQWRSRLTDCGAAAVPCRVAGPPLGGAAWSPGLPCDDPHASTKLAEVAAYLLVWGEAGNVRFMPEALYFLTELVLAARQPPPPPQQPPQQQQQRRCGGGGGLAAAAGGPFFLGVAIRPLHEVIFREWYDSIDVEDGEHVGRLKEGHRSFLPPDCGNYDDWNELFCDPERLASSLVLKTGAPLMGPAGLRHGERFRALPRVDWRLSLAAPRTKTHRELHGVVGAFAATQRIWFLHALLFFTTICLVISRREFEALHDLPLIWERLSVRLASVGLAVPLFAVLSLASRWAVTGAAAVRSQWDREQLWLLPLHVICFLPAGSYAFLRCSSSLGRVAGRGTCLWTHWAVTILGACALLFPPRRRSDALWKITSQSWATWLRRLAFWITVLIVKAAVGFVTISRTSRTTNLLQISMPDDIAPDEAPLLVGSPWFDCDLVVWLLLWTSIWLVYLADTQLWFTVASAFLGAAVRAWQCGGCTALRDEIAAIPGRLGRLLLLPEARDGAGWAEGPGAARGAPLGGASFPRSFPLIWDRIVRYLLHEDKLDSIAAGELSFFHDAAGDVPTTWERLLHEPLEHAGCKQRLTIPDIFVPMPPLENAMRRNLGILEDSVWPRNQEVQWRLQALARSFSEEIPTPYRAPYIPGMTVLIPHYREDIIMAKEDLYANNLPSNQMMPLISWLEARYQDEFRFFLARMGSSARDRGEEWPVFGRNWPRYSDKQWEDICLWASLRSQTLWRTVAGMCLYYSALQCHYEVQGDSASLMGHPSVWDASSCFTCLVSMQRYTSFTPRELRCTNRMLEQFPCLAVAFVEHTERQRYFSCLVDRRCTVGADGRRAPRLRIELPGFPLLGDGKGDNQNNALPFTRGSFMQCIDANQGGYFEQMLLLPSVLKEFSNGSSRQIVGLPEHITSDLGSIGDFGASAEFAFGTILQRSYAALGVRMHYGHPDIMNKLCMMQQGGPSKATKTLNLSEDIFAGMDFTLRGEGRRIRHCEYLHVTKGRDLGFSTLLKFISKISSGNAELLISRQAFRLGQLLPLPDYLSFFYAHCGFFLTQCFVTYSTPLLAGLYLFVVLNDCEPNFRVFDKCDSIWRAPMDIDHVAAVLTHFSHVFLLFMLVSSLPLFLALWERAGLPSAVGHICRQLLTLSPLYFIFQSKIICSCTVRALYNGGAKYINTGRGLPTQRRRFIGPLHEGGGLYLDYAPHALYDGARLLILALAGRYFSSDPEGSALWKLQLWMTVLSWLLAPFIFNPFHFHLKYFEQDLRGWRDLFLQRGGADWVEWYEKEHLRKSVGMHSLVGSVFSFFVLAALYTTLTSKLVTLTVLSEPSERLSTFSIVHGLAVCPPLLLPLAYITLCSCVDAGARWSRGKAQAPQDGKPSFVTSSSLPVTAVAVAVLSAAESLAALCVLFYMGWTKTFGVALILKYTLVDLLAELCEVLLRRSVRLNSQLSLWLYAQRMSRDIMVTLLLLVLLLPIFALVALNDCFCGGCNLHNLLVYRQLGEPMQKAVLLYQPSRRRQKEYAPLQEEAAGSAGRAPEVAEAEASVV